MNKWEAEVQKSLLNSEEAVIKELEKQYKKALKDINEKVKLFDYDIKQLEEVINADGLDDTAKAVLLSQQRSKIYQRNYQKALQGQISGILDNLHGAEYATIGKYLKECYTDGYIGTMYDIAKQGIPVIVPIDQAAVVKAVLTDSKVSKGLYDALGVNVSKLKKTITREVSRGIATGLSYSDIARNISNASNAPLSRAKTIARTEGHRIQVSATADAQHVAKAKGADVVKQWDATLDGRTRDSHRMVDGEIRELDETFSNGLKQPGDSAGGAEEVVNCRCALLTRARWALDEDELKTLEERAEFFGLDKTKNFEEYKEKYLKALENSEKSANIKSENSIASGSKEAIRYMSVRDSFYQNLEKVPVLEGYMDIACHADAFSFSYSDPETGESVQELTAKQFVKRLLTDGRTFDSPVRLFSCESGKIQDGLAQQFADEVGVEVLAPTKKVYTNSQGFVVLADTDEEALELIMSAKDKWNPDGWVSFKPRR